MHWRGSHPEQRAQTNANDHTNAKYHPDSFDHVYAVHYTHAKQHTDAIPNSDINDYADEHAYPVRSRTDGNRHSECDGNARTGGRQRNRYCCNAR
jgi:hypothetical protein